MGQLEARLDVLIVASWFPSVDDPAAGRFVADQAEALAAANVVRPLAVTFDVARLSGGATSRGRQAETVLAAAARGMTQARPLFATPAFSVAPGVPVARLSIPEGLTRSAGPTHAAVHRATALSWLAPTESAAGSFQPGVVHAHTGFPDGAAAIALADLLGWPLVVTEHASFVDRLIRAPEIRASYADVLARAHRLFAVSETLADELRAAFPDHDSTIAVLPNAVAIEAFTTGSAAERRADELLFVGYRKASKGIETLIRSVAAARARRPAISLRLVGRVTDETEEQAWRDLVQSLGMTDAVRFDSVMDRAEVAAAMRRASVFVHPSPRETFGVVAAEALASGLPVVATDSGGVTEILGADPDRLGAIVPAGDAEALGEAIVTTLERRETFDPIELRASVERRFGASFVAARLHAAYRDAIADWSPGGDRNGRTAVWTIGALPPVPQAIVVVLDREEAARRLGVLPEPVRSRLTVLTATEPGEIAIPSVGRLVESPVDPQWRPRTIPSRPARGGLAGRLMRLANDPVGTVRRRLGRDAGSDRSLAPATEALRALAEELPEAAIITIDGHDALAAEPILSADPARSSGGGLRRLADAWVDRP